jgi:prepilin-type N-terminal cleavage/methylation domain-containing protein
MRLRHTRHAAPRGFTLIELLVVIAIIGVLVGLTIAAVMAFLNKPAGVQDRAEISGMSAALQRFKAEKGFYPPSKIYLANTYAAYQNPPAGVPAAFVAQSLKTLRRMFPNLWKNNNPVDWSGGLGMPAAGYVILEGDQCLVFFLGGIPTNGGCLGFSKKTDDPTQAGGERFDYYKFKGNRLQKKHGDNFSSYMNPYDDKAQPYVYFSSGERQNGYNSAVTGLGASDCASLGVNPYASTWPAQGQTTPTPNFINPDSFQLISAGADGQFGPGTTSQATIWSLANPASAATGPGLDDLSNFAGNLIGAP